MARTVCIHYSSTDEYSINTRVRLGPSINLMQCILYLLRDGVTAETDANKPPQIADFNIIYCVHNIITILAHYSLDITGTCYPLLCAIYGFKIMPSDRYLQCNIKNENSGTTNVLIDQY